MFDSDLRALEREAHDPLVAAGLLRRRVRSGQLASGRVEAAAQLGHLPAAIAAGRDIDPGYLESGSWFDVLPLDRLLVWAWVVVQRVVRDIDPLLEPYRSAHPQLATAQASVLRLIPPALAKRPSALGELEAAQSELEDAVTTSESPDVTGICWPVLYLAFAMTEDRAEARESVVAISRDAVALYRILLRQGAEEQERQRGELLRLLLEGQ